MRKNLLNILSLAGIQGFNALLPIIIFPYLLSVLGAEKYSNMVLAENISLIMLTIVLYSYEVNGLTQIVRDRNIGKDRLSVVFSDVFYVRLGLWSFGFFAVSLYTYFYAYQLFFPILCWSLVSLGYVFQSSFLFQGLESNLPVAVFTMLSRIGCVAIILLKADPSWAPSFAPLLIGLSYLFTGVLSFIYVQVVLEIRLVWVSWRHLLVSLKRGRGIFVGNFSVVLFKDSSVLILGILGLSANSIANYSIAEKLVKAMQATMRPLNQFFYTRVVARLDSSWQPSRESMGLILRSTWVQVGIVMTFTIVIGSIWFLFKKEILSQFPTNKDISRIVFLCLIMMPATVFGIINFMLGTTGLNNLNASRYYAQSLIITGGISLLLGCSLIYFLGELGAAVSFVLGEIILLGFILHKYFQAKNRPEAVNV